ncbi:MAG: hypothetical protein PHS14_07705 [Elusimicrobia bacterium]|nr:hypothetical protein [Elusimicrobiota bacterium]
MPRKWTRTGIWTDAPKIEMSRGRPLIMQPDAPATMEIVHDVARMPASSPKAHVERADFAVKVRGFSL